MYWTAPIKKISYECKKRWSELWEIEKKLKEQKRLLSICAPHKTIARGLLRSKIDATQRDYEAKKEEIFEIDSILTEIVKRYEKSAPITIKDLWKI